MALLDLLGRRWALRILWELRAAPLSFRSLRERCDDASPSVLSTRLSELREAGLLTSEVEGYTLTAQAHALGDVLLPLGRWADRWAAEREAVRTATSGGVARTSRKRTV
jgi:DNA-binding HxlR family transcriptional regulator